MWLVNSVYFLVQVLENNIGGFKIHFSEKYHKIHRAKNILARVYEQMSAMKINSKIEWFQNVVPPFDVD